MIIFWVTSIFEAAGAVANIRLSLIPNHFNQIKRVQIRDTLCSYEADFLYDLVDGHSKNKSVMYACTAA